MLHHNVQLQLPSTEDAILASNRHPLIILSNAFDLVLTNPSIYFFISLFPIDLSPNRLTSSRWQQEPAKAARTTLTSSHNIARTASAVAGTRHLSALRTSAGTQTDRLTESALSIVESGVAVQLPGGSEDGICRFWCWEDEERQQESGRD
jgi:hypothetical protein